MRLRHTRKKLLLRRAIVPRQLCRPLPRQQPLPRKGDRAKTSAGGLVTDRRRLKKKTDTHTEIQTVPRVCTYYIQTSHLTPVSCPISTPRPLARRSRMRQESPASAAAPVESPPPLHLSPQASPPRRTGPSRRPSPATTSSATGQTRPSPRPGCRSRRHAWPYARAPTPRTRRRLRDRRWGPPF